MDGNSVLRFTKEKKFNTLVEKIIKETEYEREKEDESLRKIVKICQNLDHKR